MDATTRKSDPVFHFLAWLGGGLITLTPFVRGWSVQLSGVATPVQLWPGNLIVELIVAAALGLVGSTLGGFWWCGGGGRELRGGQLAAVAGWLWGLAGWLGYLVPRVYWAGLAVLLVAVAISWWQTRQNARHAAPPMPWNGVLCGLVLTLCVVSDLMVLEKLEGPPSALLALIVVRVLTQIVLVALVWYGLHLFVRWSQPGSRWLVGVVLGVVLIAQAAEIGMSQLWGKGLTLFFGEMEVDGKFDLLRVMEGGSFKLTPSLGLAVAGVLLGVVVIYQGCGWLSGRLRLRIRARTLLVVAAGTWLVLLLEQGLELLWNDRGGHWLQRRALLVHLCPSLSEPGVATFDIAFREPPGLAPLAVTRRPDFHVFVVETLRGDAVRAETMPFLSHWRDTECQPVGAGYAAANATHLSWFALLSGKPAAFWEQGRQAQRPAPLLERLHAAGYRTEIRSASFFNYAEMDTTNFGHGEATDVMVNTRIEPSAWPPGASERDLRVFGLWRESLLARPPGGTFRLQAVESPHYPYYWAASFTPPCPDFYQPGMFPLRPSPREIQLVRNRYHNSVAWVDSLFRDYITELKANGRYDDAMIVITGDHGEELQERGFWFHASALTPEQTAVPMIVKWPRDCGRGEPVAQASHLDLAPSILDALGCPPTQWQGMAGRSLRQGGDHSALLTTHFASQNGEGMHWRRNGYEAAFAWKKIWVPGLPQRLWLERITGPDGDLRCNSPAAAEAILREHFPDAIDRWFSRFQRDQGAD